jgi:hypothetical protein
MATPQVPLLVGYYRILHGCRESKLMKAICAMSLFLLMVSHGGVAAAHGVVGDYVFLEPLITQDPTPANELDILQRSWVRSTDANTYNIGFSMEKVLYVDDEYMPRVSV